MPDRLIELLVSEVGSGASPGFAWHVRLDGEVVASNLSLTAAQSKEVRELSRRYGQLFEQRPLPKLATDAQAAIGADLFKLWLEPAWSGLSAKLKLGDLRTVLIRSTSAAILNLPWELLRPDGGEALGSDARWAIRRVPFVDSLLEIGPAASELPAGPLRVLLMASAPLSQVELDFEREEELLLRALWRNGQEVVVDTGDMGSFAELRERINVFRPHIVHLSGHGTAQSAEASFAFEDERGQSDPRSASAIAQLFAASSVQCVFISACQAGKAPEQSALGGLAAGLVNHGTPLVIGWTASVLDDVATDVAASFYGAVASGQVSVDRALTTARQDVRVECDKQGDPSWSLPVLYAGSRQALVFDPARRVQGNRASLNLDALPGMQAGSAEHFLGRRREQQALLPSLRSGDLQAVVLTGLGGAGKSTLATRLARKLQADGWKPLAVPSSTEKPLSTGLLLQTLGEAFLKAGLREAHAQLAEADFPVATRLHLAVSVLNDHRFVLVLDNLESNLDEGSRRFLDEDLGAFYSYLLTNLVGQSRLIVTSRYLPSELTTLPLKVREYQLSEFSEAAFLKFLWREPRVEQRYRRGELPIELLRRLYRVLGGTPRFLDQIREVLIDLPAVELAGELDQVEVPLADAKDPSRLQAVRDRYCETIFTERLYGRLSEAEQRMLAQVAVFGLPMTLEGLAAVTNTGEATVRSATGHWRALALAHGDSGERWSAYGMLRAWLLAKLDEPARKAAHHAAGAFLVELNKQDREGELGVGWIACLQEARTQFIAAAALDEARNVTDEIGNALLGHGLYRELKRLHEEMLALEEHPRSLVGLARSNLELAEWRKAREDYERALHLYQQTGDRDGEAVTRHSLATIDLNEGNYQAAREMFERSLAIEQQIGDCAGEAATLHQLATIDLHEGNYQAAREKFERSLAIKQEIGNRAGEAATWHQLATIDLNEGNYQAAREKFERSLEIRQQIGDRAGEAATWHGLASINLNEGNYQAAREKFERSLAINQQIGNRDGEAATWHQLATIDLDEGNYQAAREKFERSLAINQQIGNRAGEAATWFQLGVMANKAGDLTKALKLHGLCFLIDREIGHGHAENDFGAVAQIAGELELTREQLIAELESIAKAYAQDRGKSLLG